MKLSEVAIEFVNVYSIDRFMRRQDHEYQYSRPFYSIFYRLIINKSK